LGANSLLQACVDGYFILSYTIMNFLSGQNPQPRDPDKEAEAEVKKRIQQLLDIKGTTPAERFHKDLGKILYQKCGLSRHSGDLKAAAEEIKTLKEQFYSDLCIPGSEKDLNYELEKAGRTADYFELAQLIVKDALHREESCGAHFREEHQTQGGEARRNDADFGFVSLWEHTPAGFQLHKELLTFEFLEPSERDYS